MGVTGAERQPGVPYRVRAGHSWRLLGNAGQIQRCHTEEVLFISVRPLLREKTARRSYIRLLLGRAMVRAEVVHSDRGRLHDRFEQQGVIAELAYQLWFVVR